jgi:hypothetical protein
VKAFVEEATADRSASPTSDHPAGDPRDKAKIPCAFIITGPNIASQGLLFEQLEEALSGSTPSKFVRLRSTEATNLKAILARIVRETTSRYTDDEDDDNRLTIGKLVSVLRGGPNDRPVLTGIRTESFSITTWRLWSIISQHRRTPVITYSSQFRTAKASTACYSQISYSS